MNEYVFVVVGLVDYEPSTVLQVHRSELGAELALAAISVYGWIEDLKRPVRKNEFDLNGCFVEIDGKKYYRQSFDEVVVLKFDLLD